MTDDDAPAPGCSSPVDLELGLFFGSRNASNHCMISPYFNPSARVMNLKTSHLSPCDFYCKDWLVLRSSSRLLQLGSINAGSSGSITRCLLV